MTKHHLLPNVKKGAKVPGRMQCQTLPYCITASADTITNFLQTDVVKIIKQNYLLNMLIQCHTHTAGTYFKFWLQQQIIQRGKPRKAIHFHVKL